MAFPMSKSARSALAQICARCLPEATLRARPPVRFPRAAFEVRSSWLRSLHTGPTRSPARGHRHGGEALSGRRQSSRVAASAAHPWAPPSYREPPRKRVLGPDDLFHPFSKSPIPEIRRRAATLRQYAWCPHPDHKPMRTPESAPGPEVRNGTAPPAHVDFECPDCGIAVYCSKEHWAEDYENHLKICDTLRQINEDDHDLRSGRQFPEFDYADGQIEEALINMTDWDHFLYSRNFDAIDDLRSLRQATLLLTYPITVASVIHELSPYNVRPGGRLTAEGLKSVSALRYTLHPPPDGSGEGVKGLRPRSPPWRLFVLGARAESSLPRDVWEQIVFLFPDALHHIIMIGPESMMNRDDEFPLPERTATNPFGAVIERVNPITKMSTIVDYFHNIHRTGHFAPYDPYFDCFVLFHPGLGHPASSHEWAETLPMLLETKVPIIVTGYTKWDMDRDIAWVHKQAAGEFDILLEPGENRFRSLRWQLNDVDSQDISAANWGVWAFRGKRYETTRRDSDEAGEGGLEVWM